MKPHPAVSLLLLCLLPLWWTETQAESAIPLKELSMDHNQETLQKGAEMVLGLCVSCHDLQYLRYRNLREIGFSKARIELLRGDRDLEDPILSLTSTAQRRALFGRVPPDLSLIAKAREGGPAYVYTLLTSFYTTPEGRVDNRLFPGIKMPDALGSSSPGNQAAVDRTAREVALFLAWAADPRAEERHRLGLYVLAYLALLTFLLYLNKRRVWQRLPADNPEIDPASTKASP